jgi:hypothetical protein
VATRPVLTFEDIYTDFEARLVREGRSVLVKDEKHGRLLEERLNTAGIVAEGGASYDQSLLVRISEEERSFFEELHSELFLGDKRERTQEIIAELRAIQKIKGADRGTYDSDDALMALHEELLIELSSIITPYGYVPDSQEDFLRRKSMDVIVETYLDDKRLNQIDFAVLHPIGMARAASFLGHYFSLDKDIIVVNQLSALRHDVRELLDDRLKKLDIRGLSKQKRKELKRHLHEAYDPEKKFKTADKRIKNYMILHAVEAGMEPNSHLLDLVDAVRYTSVHLTKPMGVSWDKNFKKAVKKRTIEEALRRWESCEEKRKEQYPLVRAGVCIDKPCDSIYNSTDFDDILEQGESVFSLKKRLKIMYKSIQLFNALSQEYASGNFEGEEYHTSAHVLLKKAMMYFILPETGQMLEYVMRSSRGESLSESVIERKIRKFVEYDHKGYDVARKRQKGEKQSTHPDDDPDGTLRGLRLLVREKDMTLEERSSSKDEFIRLRSSSELFSRILAVHRLAELNYMDPYRIIRNF